MIPDLTDRLLSEELSLFLDNDKIVRQGNYPSYESPMSDNPNLLAGIEILSPFVSYLFASNILEAPDYRLEPSISKDGLSSLLYAYKFLKISGRFYLGEYEISKSPEYSFFYAYKVIGGEFPEGEISIAQDGEYSYSYSSITNERFKLGEINIFKIPTKRVIYFTNFFKERSLELEKEFHYHCEPQEVIDYIYHLMLPIKSLEYLFYKNPIHSYFYAIYILNRRFPKGEPYICEHKSYALSYMGTSFFSKSLESGRWKLLEDRWKHDPNFCVVYARLIGKRFYEGEDSLKDNPSEILCYCKTVGCRVPELEPSILASGYGPSYIEFLNNLKHK